MAKQDKAKKAAGKQSVTGTHQDDALFETLGKNKKRKKRKIIIMVVSIS